MLAQVEQPRRDLDVLLKDAASAQTMLGVAPLHLAAMRNATARDNAAEAPPTFRRQLTRGNTQNIDMRQRARSIELGAPPPPEAHSDQDMVRRELVERRRQEVEKEGCTPTTARPSSSSPSS